MPRYNIVYVTAASEHKEEVLEAADQASLYSDLRQRNDTLVSCTEITTTKKKFGFNIDISFLSRIKLHDKIIFTKNLGAMIDAGLPLSRALAVIEKQTKQKKFKDIIVSIGKSISQGHTLNDSLKEYPQLLPLIS